MTGRVRARVGKFRYVGEGEYRYNKVLIGTKHKQWFVLRSNPNNVGTDWFKSKEEAFAFARKHMSKGKWRKE